MGLLVAILWIPAIADDTIGVSIASGILGKDAASVTITSAWFSFAFAIAAGLANTFTACNCVVFSCIAPLSGQKSRTNLGVWRLLMWMAIGVIAATVIYSLVSTFLSTQLPMLSKSVLPIGRGFPERLLQSAAVFTILGIVLLYWGLVTLKFAPNPFRQLVERRAWMLPLFLGVIVGCFSVGRPYPLFQTLFRYTISSGDFFLSAALMAIQGLGNIAIMALLFLLLTIGTRGRFEQWMQAHPRGIRMLTAVSVIGGGIFFIAYWGLRLPAAFGIGWFPHL
ncbi:MAG TPA: hypothetical protein VN729_00230 [Ktedonobacteraceae bacterium]|nr:hypothetical protein [Ktedonobacteraceae bacterium]